MNGLHSDKGSCACECSGMGIVEVLIHSGGMGRVDELIHSGLIHGGTWRVGELMNVVWGGRTS